MNFARALRSVLASQEEVAAGEERQVARAQGTTAIGDLESRRRAVVSGVLRSVVLRPSEHVRAVEAELYDGSGALDLVWLGRRQIAGIEPGRRLLVEGMVGEIQGRRRMVNPKYELLPSSCEE